MERKQLPATVLNFPSGGLPVASAAEEAYTALFARTYERLRRYVAIELNDDDAAEDLVQKVLVAIWYQHFRDAESVHEDRDALVYRMVKFHLKNYRRDRVRYLARLRIHLGMWAGRTKRWMIPAEYVEHDELVTVLDQAMSKMTPRCREVFFMHREGRMTFKEIAELNGVTVSTVNNLMHKAHMVMRKHVDRAGFGSSARRRIVDKVGKKGREE
jgi:RNA polymerase sigma-70 factor (ECF subfamily)